VGKQLEIIKLKDEDIIIKTYKIRKTGRHGATLETTIPKEVFERDARRLGLSFDEAVKTLVAVWRYNGFRGLHLSFEQPERLGFK